VEGDELFDEELVDDYREEDTQRVEVTLALFNADQLSTCSPRQVDTGLGKVTRAEATLALFNMDQLSTCSPRQVDTGLGKVTRVEFTLALFNTDHRIR